ncbi:precorrin-8X methylmutase [Methanopyrus sp. KOL6]|uniref:precorrin-8X methylmutase n=1 Tax=Methanopyrus sp. KOL6 TaxID=1937004 RepID=UPI000B4AD3AB|nr:precorrin-8X methylmutase [Methanopyrus sp. KOL6]
MTLGERTSRGRSIAERSLERWIEKLGEPENLEDLLSLRISHATWDPFVSETLRIEPSEEAVVEGLESAEVVAVDVGMVAAGIRRSVDRIGLETVIASEVGERVHEDTVTGDGMRRILEDHRNVAVVVGNAPTAAEKVAEYPESIAVSVLFPVGIGAIETKRAAADTGVPVVTNVSVRGGTPLAVAAFNALVDYVTGNAL